MSRSNHHYYNLCHRWGDIGEDGYCDFHRYRRRQHCCIPPAVYLTRRRVIRRRSRFPEGSPKSWHRAPPAWWWRSAHRRARAIQRQEMLRNPEDPVITPDKRLIDLWGWY
jgi:hypothetical protein